MVSRRFVQGRLAGKLKMCFLIHHWIPNNKFSPKSCKKSRFGFEKNKVDDGRRSNIEWSYYCFFLGDPDHIFRSSGVLRRPARLFATSEPQKQTGSVEGVSVYQLRVSVFRFRFHHVLEHLFDQQRMGVAGGLRSIHSRLAEPLLSHQHRGFPDSRSPDR